MKTELGASARTTKATESFWGPWESIWLPHDMETGMDLVGEETKPEQMRVSSVNISPISRWLDLGSNSYSGITITALPLAGGYKVSDKWLF